ncbi:DUF547 domain-containing protein [Leptospira idonii]|uniref:DUF547 domain-containing protein n=1 Tax=Leptospira idonii TaxID=1193500 RepID=A0A4R9M195_9LEPT|nr:DUF547 domain-containing protein [Leptospira idonii]TGN19595.1 DUF547 domain-containing protein [Leptospira idonii]
MKRSLLISVFFSFVTGSVLAQGFDHSHKTWDSLSHKYVVNGLVSYKGIASSDQSVLKSYLDSLSQVSETEYSKFTKEEKLAFLINAYNAFTVQLILDHYPLKSITDIGGPFSKLNLLRGHPWKKEFFSLLGKTRTLDWIEHEKLRKDFSEPRIHFAIVCASIGCPTLISGAYIPSKLEQQLQSAKLGFLKNPSKNSYDKEKNLLRLSPIFQWFQEDFTKKTTLIEFIQEGFSEKVRPDALIEYSDYSWKLNELKTN